MSLSLRQRWRERGLPAAAKMQRRKDARGLPALDPGPDRIVDEGMAWLFRAQDCSASDDGGVAALFNISSGWATSYPETTGYIVPTLIACARRRGVAEGRERARRMLTWLVGQQLPCGGFQGGRIGAKPLVPVTFNTGQVLLGLAAGFMEFGDYEQALRRAADWLVLCQDTDGCWRKFPTPFASPGEKTYETHTAWGLLEAERSIPGRGYADAALRQIRWALTWQRDNGWIDCCCLSDSSQPLTHTLGYALRGIVEAYRFTEDRFFLDAALRTADELLLVFGPDGHLPGRLRSDWTAAVDWACLTGTVQIAHSLLMLYDASGRGIYRDVAFRANQYVRRTVLVDGPADMRGGVKGSFPIGGDYNPYAYLSWATKFALDSNMLELEIRNRDGSTRPSSRDFRN